jgi:hypothetical protein
MLSNYHLTFKLGTVFSLLLALCIYSEIVGLAKENQRAIAIRSCITNNDNCHNQLFFLGGRLVSSSKNTFQFLVQIQSIPKWFKSAEQTYTVTVNGHLKNLGIGEGFSLLARFDRNGIVEMVKYEKELLRTRITKYIVSIVGLILSLNLLFNRFRRSPHRVLPLRRR